MGVVLNLGTGRVYQDKQSDFAQAQNESVDIEPQDTERTGNVVLHLGSRAVSVGGQRYNLAVKGSSNEGSRALQALLDAPGKGGSAREKDKRTKQEQSIKLV